MKSLFASIFVFLLLWQTNAQQNFNATRKLQNNRLYNEAIMRYTRMLDHTSDSAAIAYELGLCYFNINQFDQAEHYFLLSQNKGNESSNGTFMLAQTCLRNLKYDQAKVLFNEVANAGLTSGVDSASIAFSNEKASVLAELKQISHLNLQIGLTNLQTYNSEFSEYGIDVAGTTLYFSSMRKLKNKATDSRTLQGFSDMYKVSLIHGDFEKPVTEWLPDELNTTQFNEACPDIDAGESNIYFTRCYGKPAHCQIMLAQKNEQGEWQKAKAVDLGSSDFSTGHPAVSPNGSMMVFVSDMPGGFGKRDLYMADVNGSEWVNIRNAGLLVNSAYDEMFPSFLNDSVLVFSSEGHRAIGGLDIFVTVFRNGEWQMPVRLAPGINSGADDFNFLLTDRENGLLCSNRPGGFGSDDIYSFSGFPVLVPVNIQVNDSKSLLPIQGATIMIRYAGHTDTIVTDEKGLATMWMIQKDEAGLVIAANNYRTEADSVITQAEKSLYPQTIHRNYSLTPDDRGITIEGEVTDASGTQPIDNQKLMLLGSNGYFDQTATDSSGYYEFTHLQDNNAYKLLMARKGYWTQTKDISIPDLNSGFNFSSKSGFDLDFNLQPIQENEEIVINDIYYDFDKATLKKESEKELDKLVNMLGNNPNISVEISSHTDSRGPDDYNQRLSQARAESVVMYLVKKGISQKRLLSKGYGESRPLIVNAVNEDDHQKNRRTSFRVISVSDINDNDLLSYNINDQGQTPSSVSYQPNTNIVYKVQVCASRTPLESDNYFTKLDNALPDLIVVEEKYPDGFYRYIAGTFTSYEEAVQLRDNIIAAGYSDCFIGAYKNNKRVE